MILKLLLAIKIELFAKQLLGQERDEVEVVNEVIKKLNLLKKDGVVLS
jgi:hypothetical protein